MARNKNDRPDNSGDQQPPKESREKSTRNEDIHDSQRDRDRLAPDETFIDLPDVKDIPGQEFIHVPRMGEMADTTISSDDEEGVGIFNDNEDEDAEINMGTENDIPREDKVALERTELFGDGEEDQRLSRSALDRTDLEGESLNESFDRTGEDLDVPGAENDDRDESIGEEDEENNPYSLGSDSNDNMNEGTP